MIASDLKYARHTLYRSLLDVFYPPLCTCCQKHLISAALFLCPACRQQITPFNGGLDKALAGRSFDQLYILFEYGPVIRELIHLLKYKHYLSLCRLFAREAGDRFSGLRAENYTAIVPVPLHRTRLRERGYNQSEELARALAAEFDIRLKSERLLRSRHTSSQTKKSRQQREDNMKDAFICRGTLRGERLLLVDDVVTTGSTIESCIRILRKAGAVRVDVLAVAHPPETG